MTVWDAKRRATYARFAYWINATDASRQTAVDCAFARLRVMDPSLVKLALDAFGDAGLAAECLAWPRPSFYDGNAYAALANGRRALVAEWLRTHAEDNQPHPGHNDKD